MTPTLQDPPWWLCLKPKEIYFELERRAARGLKGIPTMLDGARATNSQRYRLTQAPPQNKIWSEAKSR